ncbi:MAG: hypothetical protein AMS27_07130 [Bacteroides sp. SM23_62_1]|nr:MAG: hypothetical protein AMS27_07130 [Bacteroides sp. SM23_62_1]
MVNSLRNIVLVGAGNVATHLGFALKNLGYQITQVYSRTKKSAIRLSSLLDTGYTTNINLLDNRADLYLFCLKDDGIMPVLCRASFTNQVLVHTSGTLPLSVFQGCSKNYAVLYPVQTFSRLKKLDLKGVPLCIEANNPDILATIETMAKEISGNVLFMDSDKRKILHLAAIFACNFPNHMYFLAEKILSESGLNFDLLKPLIMETASKILEIDPFSAQTGPAMREDQRIIEEHLRILKDLPDIQKLYTFVSDSISAYRGSPARRTNKNIPEKNE